MNKYVVSRFEKVYENHMDTTVEYSQQVEADKAVITAGGDLKLSNKQGGLVKAFAYGRWDECYLVQEEPTPEQQGIQLGSNNESSNTRDI